VAGSGFASSSISVLVTRETADPTPRAGLLLCPLGSHALETAALGLIQQPAVSDRRGCNEAPAGVGADDRFRHAARDRPATALATRRRLHRPDDARAGPHDAPGSRPLLLSSDMRLLVRHETSHDFGAAYPAWRCRIRAPPVRPDAPTTASTINSAELRPDATAIAVAVPTRPLWLAPGRAARPMRARTGLRHNGNWGSARGLARTGRLNSEPAMRVDGCGDDVGRARVR
jgi:hypothetical protein